MKTRFAIVGFRHNHIFDLLAALRERSDCEVVACCEENAATRAELDKSGRVAITDEDFTKMLREVECDVVSVGDVYARRGGLVIAALRSGRHVLADKPLCTNLSEQVHIEDLAISRGLSVGLQFDCRDSGAFLKLREIVRSGELGAICTVHVTGQHPLLLESRPRWYFEPGQHGGTINDIGIHAFDFIPWITGLAWQETIAARSWNAKAKAFPHFHDCAQLMARLENGAGVQADFSYLAPDQAGSGLPHYWHVTVHGTLGMAETYYRAATVDVVLDHYEGVDHRPAASPAPRSYLDAFLKEVRGERTGLALTTAECLRATRLAIDAQRRATD